MAGLLRPGQEIELAISGLAAGGDGIGRHCGMAVFVAGTAPGDRVRAIITRTHRQYAQARLLEVLIPAPSRVPPRCRLAGRCGGCQLQHIHYESQLEFKRQLVVDALARIGKLGEVPVDSCRPAPELWGYRNKAQFPTTMVRDGRGRRLAAGIYEAGTHNLVEVGECAIQHPLNSQALAATVDLARRHGIEAYDEDTGAGSLRHILVRSAAATGEVMVVLVTRESQLPGVRSLARSLREQVPEVVTVAQNVNPRRTNVILGPHTRIVAGRGYLTDRLGPHRFRISPGSFFQVNPGQAEVLCQLAADRAAAGPGDTVIEVYAGIGTITLCLAERAGLVLGVESHAPAVEDARRNAAANRVTNVRFVRGEAEAVLPGLVRSGLTARAVVLDPPRRGCAPPALEAIAGLGSPRVVYVSCNPATLARDLAFLAGRGYRTEEVIPLDMFPMTAHVEAVALLVRSA